MVTPLAQVAAFAPTHVGVAKTTDDGGPTSVARVVDGEARVVELSRMLSGTPDSERVRDAAAGLLARAGEDRR